MSKIINIPGLLLCFVVMVLPLTVAGENKIDYQIYLDGRKLDMGQKAIKVSEFAPMVINLSNSENKIRKLKVTLARGNRAVDSKKISGNHINLGSFKSVARPGDRLVFEIFTGKKNRSQNQPLLVVAIPVI
jgi:hypothetical protein